MISLLKKLLRMNENEWYSAANALLDPFFSDLLKND